VIIRAATLAVALVSLLVTGRTPALAGASDKQKPMNRLANEKSPYLLQHADNPVDWHPWSPEAFRKSKEEDKPIFLSIGYSTCHWCHVMEHESFENETIAAFLNEHFVSIKVDREERPDIDGIYMSAVLAMTSRGGWPLSVFMTADQKPFFGGTYFPPFAKWGEPGFIDVLRSIDNAWQHNREQLMQSGDQIAMALQEAAGASKGEGKLDASLFTSAGERFKQIYDAKHGGFGNEPKFPSSHNLDFLLRHWYSSGDERSLTMVLETLRRMAEGGIHDHLGGGFHRYATDRMWQIPHFEKMLYDQAGLSRTYVQAYQITKDAYFADVAKDIYSYVLAELRDSQGGFYSAEDADSLDPDEKAGRNGGRKKEGAFYVWRYDEIKSALNGQQWDAFRQRFDVKEEGNARSDPHGEFMGKNILFALETPQEVAAKTGKSPEATQKLLAQARRTLKARRDKRPRPHLDDKIITDWNGLMISSLAFGARVLDDDEYLKAAEQAADFIMKRLITPDGRLYHRYRDGDVAVKGSLEDYAFFIDGLLELYQSSFKEKYLKEALRLSEAMVELFWDEQAGGFFFTADDAEELLLRQKELYDGAMPSGNSVAASVLVRLYHITLDDKWQRYFQESAAYFSDQLAQMPGAYAKFLTAYQHLLGPSLEIVIAAKEKDALAESFAREISAEFLPHAVLLLRPSQNFDGIAAIAPFLKEQVPIDGAATVYLCQNHVCKLPVRDEGGLRRLLDTVIKKP
jgi:uncharacterized protein YyaL (SSP411 family)